MTYFREWNRRPRGMETPLHNHQEKCQVKRYFKYQWYTIFNGYSTIIYVILHIFIICYGLWSQLPPFFLQTFRHDRSAVFGTMPLMCRSCPDVNKLRGMDTTILGQHRPFMSIKSFIQHSGWQEMVSLCLLIRLIAVCADCDQPEFFCSRSDSRYLEIHVATAGGWLTCYRPREVRNSIHRYGKIHIDYRSKFLYRFISSIDNLRQHQIGWPRQYHGWPFTQPGSLHTALQRKYTQPCSLFSRGTPVWTMMARLCEQWGTAVCQCPAVKRVTREYQIHSVWQLKNFLT